MELEVSISFLLLLSLNVHKTSQFYLLLIENRLGIQRLTCFRRLLSCIKESFELNVGNLVKFLANRLVSAFWIALPKVNSLLYKVQRSSGDKHNPKFWLIWLPRSRFLGLFFSELKCILIFLIYVHKRLPLVLLILMLL